MNTREYTPESHVHREGAELRNGDEAWLHLGSGNAKPYDAVPHESLPEKQVVAERITPQREVGMIAIYVIHLRKTAQNQQNGTPQAPRYGDYEFTN